MHTSIPSDLISRDQELSTIREFVDRTIKKSKQGSLYMSGAPGTGKTACLTKVLEHVNVSLKFGFNKVYREIN